MTASLVSFSLAAALIVLLPGPDTLVVLRNLVRGGRRTATLTVLGVLSGLVVWVGAAALGLAAVLHASEAAYTVLRIVGAIYLVWIGVQSLRSRGSVPDVEDALPERRGLLGRGYGAGLATDLLNPKVGVFFVTFLPGFVPDGRPVGPVSLLLGAVFVLETAFYFALLLLLAGRITGWLADSRTRRRMDRLTGLVLVGFGARLAAEG
ncbi:threonine/homoserine/homoserine lactone efflux protein [Motilibacter peucedani]|uniref:Threonine/homoserine/homoserine lactone efflux protein n=1 Tax=Motilibacter peucedani TaxID=598650 RepID=A0A420XSV1_9ACTN|nr:LysE family translocator [Motilibacter peucedani]RKS77901.1 threonine/homoserine/homoserine lactone efflux protein [Motilibacter peucedani]